MDLYVNLAYNYNRGDEEMKESTIRTIGLVSSIVIIIASGMRLVNNFMIPGLLPISVVIMMLCLIYSTKQKVDKELVSKIHYKIIFIIAIIALILNVIQIILEIINAL